MGNVFSFRGRYRLWTLFSWYWGSKTRVPSRTIHGNTLPSDFFTGRRGALLHSRYRIHVKLGGGVYSNTYLVTDENSLEKQCYRAVKVLSRDATADCRGDNRRMLELDVMHKIRENGEHDTLPHLRDVFEICEDEKPVHTCVVMDLLGSDLGTFRRSAHNKALPHYTVRIVMKQVVDALVHLHDIGIVHTDIKPDNMLFRTWMDAEDINKWLRDISSSNQDGIEASHPLPVPPELTWDCPIEVARRIKVTLVDLGQAQWANRSPTVDQFSAFSLRAPEVILQSDFTTAIDIWAIGCIVFEMLVGRWLFHPVDGGDDWTLGDDHLAKMVEFTGERFSEAMRSRAHRGSQYFDSQGNFLRVPDLCPVPIEDALANYKILPEEEIIPATDFIRACIRLEPRDRPTAKQLASHPWLQII